MDEVILVFTDAVGDTGPLFDRLRARTNVSLALVDDQGEVRATSAGYSPSVSVHELLRVLNQSSDDYDASIRASHLLRFPVRGAIAAVSTEAFVRRNFMRNAIVHSVDSARVCQDRLCLILRNGIGAGHDDIDRAAGGDEHLQRSLQQVGLELGLEDDADEIARIVTDYWSEKQRLTEAARRRRRSENLARRIPMAGMVFASAGLACALLTAVTFLFYQRSPPTWVPWPYFLALYSAVWGAFIAAVPTASAYSTFPRDPDVISKKRWLHAIFVLQHGFFLALFALVGYRTWLQPLAMAFGFAWTIAFQSNVLGVFLFRARLKGIAPPYFGVGTEEEEFRVWDTLAKRVVVTSRSFMRPNPRVFISYAWPPAPDVAQAQAIEASLKELGVTAILLKAEDVRKASPWRAAIAESILSSTHVLFLLSRNSIRARTCADELRYALATMKFSVQPTVSVCFLEQPAETELRKADHVFRYLTERAPQVALSDLLDKTRARSWLEERMPAWWLRDIFH